MKTTTCFIALIAVGLVIPSASFAARKLNVKIVGSCDAQFNNYTSGPEQVADVPSGSTCTMKATVKRNGRPLKGIAVTMWARGETADSEVASKRTNSSGVVQISFPFSDEVCFYDVQERSGKSRQITLFHADDAECSIDNG